MKKLTKFLFIILSLSILLSLISCDEGKDDHTIVAISEKNITLTELGEVYILAATVYPANDNASIKWSTSNPEVATCINGVVTAMGYGVCVIRASFNNVTAACTVSVPDPSPNVFLSESELVLNDIGEEASLSAKTDDGADITVSVNWSSSNTDIVTCSNGKLKATGYGICTITAIRDNKTDSCVVTVEDPRAPRIALSSDELKIAIGETQTLSYTKTDNAGSTITWITSDEKVATCENGKIRGVAKGVCAIVAISENGTSDACIVTVGDYAPPTLPEDLVLLEMRGIPKTIKYVSSKTGQVNSIVAVTSYNIEYYRVGTTLELVITFNCVKIYDSKGPGGTTPIIFMTNLYKEDGVHCEKRFHTKAGIVVGEGCIQESPFVFRVQLSKDGPRKFYAEFPPIIEI